MGLVAGKRPTPLGAVAFAGWPIWNDRIGARVRLSVDAHNVRVHEQPILKLATTINHSARRHRGNGNRRRAAQFILFLSSDLSCGSTGLAKRRIIWIA